MGLSVQENKIKIDFQNRAAANLDFWLDWCPIFFIYKSSQYLLPSVESVDLSIQDNKFKR